MSTALLDAGFVIGEVAPSMFGRFDLARIHSACSTLRNMTVSYQGGAFSRAGTGFTGFSKQTGRAFPPRLVPFQFNINQGLALEFGNFYMRVIFEGAYVTEPAYTIGGVSQTSPAVVSYTATGGAVSATANVGGITASYNSGDQITLAGGSFTTPAVLGVTTTQLTGLSIGAFGSGYAPGDNIALAGGVQEIEPIVTVATTQVITASIVSGGTGGVSGTRTLIGTTGTGTPVQCVCTVAGGVVTAILSISVPGNYSTNPSDPHNEPMSNVGGFTTAPVFNLTMGIKSLGAIAGGSFTTNSSTFTQSSTSGSGIGATFTAAIFGPNALSVVTAGLYTAVPNNPIAQASTTGTGTGSTFNVMWNVPASAQQSGALSATANEAGVTASYNTGDQITLLGGVSLTRATLGVASTQLVSLAVNAPGTLYAPADNINLAGGTQLFPPVLNVNATTVVAAAIVTGGTTTGNGARTLIGTTGSGTLVQCECTAAGGHITVINSITVAGNYTVNPNTPSAEPMMPVTTQDFSVLPVFNLTMGVLAVGILAPGQFTTNSTTLTQASTSGTGTGATFNAALFGPSALSVITAGVYTTLPPSPTAQASTTGTGVGATFNVIWQMPAVLQNGDWVFIQGVSGMTELNGNTFVIESVTATSFALFDVYGNPIDATAFPAYAGGGTAARIYTQLTPYAEQDLPWLKWTQSADVMSICCVNQDTSMEYPPQDLTRLADDNWTFTTVVPGATINPPTNVTVTASATGAISYSYQVTAVNPDDGSESRGSVIGGIEEAVDISATAGSLQIFWVPESGVGQYNVYKAVPAFNLPIPVGALFGFVGTALGGRFIDSNITADFDQVPPTAQNPFARGTITGVTITAVGSGGTFIPKINTSTGSGASLQALVTNGQLTGFYIYNGGQNYLPTDTVTITGGAKAVLQVSPESGTYPSVPAYFQERRAYANTLNQPDTYFMSQPGAFTNFNSRIPTIDSDAITGSPWSVEVNGIQWMIDMPGGLVVFTGLEAWQLTGTGGSSLNPQPITPASQQAQPQAYNGCSALLPPIKIDYDIIYVQAKGSIYRDLSYNFYANIYTGTDITINSSHLFSGFSMVQHAWTEEPYKILWAVRDDGILLSLTYLKPEQVNAWARHDTNGIFVSVCSITEPPVDALYVATQRMFGLNQAYVVERMDNRIWSDVEDTWCVDCGFDLPQPTPAATLTASSATGLGSITGVTNLVGGSGYSLGTTAQIVDDNGEGPGTGATPTTLSITAGVIMAIGFGAGAQGGNYINPALVFYDPANTGSGASASPILNNTMTFTASAPVFSSGNVGSVIRMGGGKAVITAYNSPTSVTANMLSPITEVYANSGNVPVPQISGNWTMSAPVDSVYIPVLANATVTGLYDGNVIPPTIVPANGVVDLPAAASQVTIGLGFQARLQTVYLDAGPSPTVQGQRKKIAGITARLYASRGIKCGSNQPDGSTLSPAQIAPTWNNLSIVPDMGKPAYNDTTIPLYSGDTFQVPTQGGFAKPGQLAFQQDNPLPMNILALIPALLGGDTPEQEAKPRDKGRQRQQG